MSSIPKVSITELEQVAGDFSETPALLGFSTASWLNIYNTYGPVFELQESGQLFLCGEKVSREMWKNGSDWGYAETAIGKVFQSELGAEYITASDGDLHRYQRRMLRPLFNGAAIHQFLPLVAQQLKRSFAEEGSKQIELHNTLIFFYTRLLNNTMVKSGASDDQIRRFAQFEEEFIRGVFLDETDKHHWYARPDYQQLRSEVMGFFGTLVNQRLSGQRVGDNLDVLIDSMREKNKTALNTDEIVRDAYLMQAGGAGNMATLCCTLLWKIINNKTWYKRLREEFASLDPMQAMQTGLARLPFMRALMLETERYFPLTHALPKLSLNDVHIMGYAIPKGTEVMHFFVLSHFMEDSYEQPFLFNPERWLTDKPNRPHAFGGGEHVCIGQNISYLFIVITLQVLFSDYELSASAPPYQKAVSNDVAAPMRTAFDLSLMKRQTTSDVLQAEA